MWLFPGKWPKVVLGQYINWSAKFTKKSNGQRENLKVFTISVNNGEAALKITAGQRSLIVVTACVTAKKIFSNGHPDRHYLVSTTIFTMLIPLQLLCILWLF